MLQKILKNILTTSLNVLHNYFDNSTKIIFLICIQLKLQIFQQNRFFPVTTNNHYHSILYRKNDFVEVSKNFTRYRSENNFVYGSSK